MVQVDGLAARNRHDGKAGFGSFRLPLKEPRAAEEQQRADAPWAPLGVFEPSSHDTHDERVIEQERDYSWCLDIVTTRR